MAAIRPTPPVPAPAPSPTRPTDRGSKRAARPAENRPVAAPAGGGAEGANAATRPAADPQTLDLYGPRPAGPVVPSALGRLIDLTA